MRRVTPTLSATVAFLCLAAVIRADDEPARREPAPLDVRRGSLVSLAGPNLILRTRTDDGGEREVTVILPDSTQFFVNREPGAPASLKPGMSVIVRLVDNGVMRVEAATRDEGPPGTRDARDVGERRDLARRDGERPADPVPAEPRRDVPPGDRVTAAVPATAPAPASAGRWEEMPSKRAYGAFLRREGTAFVMTMGDAGREVYVGTDEQTRVQVDKEPASLDDLKPGMIVVILQVDGLTTSIEARAPKKPIARPDAE